MTMGMGKAASGVALALVLSFGIASAQSPHPSALSSTAPAKPDWDTSLPGKWTYRSYINRADILVNADPDPAVQALTPIFGSGAATAASSLKALNLIFGEGVMTFDPPAGNSLTGNFDMGGGYVLDLKGTARTSASGDITIDIVGTGRPGTKTDNWEYDYKATTTPKWPNGVGQVPTLVGTVIRAKPHDGAPAGVVASFIAIKQ
jgi:hypothetical protein